MKILGIFNLIIVIAMGFMMNRMFAHSGKESFYLVMGLLAFFVNGIITGSIISILTEEK